MRGIGVFSLAQYMDDYGSWFVPYTTRCVDDFGNLLVFYDFAQSWFNSRAYFLEN